MKHDMKGKKEWTYYTGIYMKFISNLAALLPTHETLLFNYQGPGGVDKKKDITSSK